MTTPQSRLLSLVGIALGLVSLVLAQPIGLVPSAQAQSTTQCQTTEIMPLGDSITAGRGSDGQAHWKDLQYMTGYRQPLYLALKERGYAVDFVGGEQAGQLATPSFDTNHEGHSGYTPSQIAYPNATGEGGITNWLAAHPADIVLLHIGTNGNGLNQNSIQTQVARTEEILTRIDQHSSDTVVILARIINRKIADTPPEERQKTTDFNIALQQMADRRIANGDKIIVVDMEPVLDYAGDLADALHPNEGGYEKMMVVWLHALESLLTPCSTSVPPTTQKSIFLPVIHRP